MKIKFLTIMAAIALFSCDAATEEVKDATDTTIDAAAEEVKAAAEAAEAAAAKLAEEAAKVADSVVTEVTGMEAEPVEAEETH